MTTLPRWASSSLLLSGLAYANCGNPDVLNGLQSYTLEAWVNLGSLNGSQSVIGKRNMGVNGVYQLYIQNGYVFSYYPSGTNTIKSPQPLDIKKWHHLATTYEWTTGTLSLYIDGNLVAQQVFPYSTSTSTANVLIGATLNNGALTWFFQGMIGEVMIWNVCRTAEEVLNDSVQISYQGDTAVPSLLMDLDFSLLPAADWGGNNIQASLQQGAKFGLAIPGLKLNAPAYADCGNAPDLSMGGTKPYTIEGWFYYFYDGGTVVSKVDQGTAGEYLVSVAHKRVTSLRGGLDFSLSSPQEEVVPFEYYHFATTFDEQTRVLSLYVNGNLQCCKYAPNMSTAPSVPLLIGAMLSNTSVTEVGGPTNFFQGYIQNIRIWNICLEQNQIQQWMYNQPIFEPNLVAGFDFTVDPPVDTTGKHTVQLKNGAVIDVNLIAIDPLSPEAYPGFIQSINAEYFSEYEVIPDPPPPLTPTFAAAGSFAPFTPEFKNASWADLEKRSLSDADEETRQQMRDRFEQAYAQASAMVAENPNLLKPFTVVEENGLVKIIHHGIEGDSVIFEAPAAEVEPCTLWWIEFVYMLTAGFYQALGLVPSFGNVASRIYDMLCRNPAVVAAFNSIIGQSVSVGAGMGVVYVIYQQGYTWPILKMIFSSAGWWTLAWILKKVIALATGLEAAEALSGFLIWAGKLTNLSLEYKGACVTPETEETPTPAVA